MSEKTRIPTRPCTHCFAGREPLDGHTVEELRKQMAEDVKASPGYARFTERVERVQRANAGREDEAQ